MKTKVFQLTLFAGLIILPVALIILPANFFDSGQSVCLSVLMFNTPCPGCGMTRAIQHLIHFDLAGASAYNKMAFMVFPILTFVWYTELRKTYKKLKFNPSLKSDSK